MKKAYVAPQLTNHGNVESITLGFGAKVRGDIIYKGDSNLPGDIQSEGSRDGTIIPV